MRRLIRLYRRFIASTRGVVAIEFAAILPVLLLMLLATFDGGNAIAVYMKVRSATYVLASVTNQYSTAMPIQSSNMTGIMSATSAVLAPYSRHSGRCRHFGAEDSRRESDHRYGALERYTEWHGSGGRIFCEPPDRHCFVDQYVQHVSNVLSDPCPSELYLYAAVRLFCQRRDHVFRYRVRHAAQQQLRPLRAASYASFPLVLKLA